MAYDCDVQYVPGQLIGPADVMSRLRFKDGSDVSNCFSYSRETLHRYQPSAEIDGNRSFQQEHK